MATQNEQEFEPFGEEWKAELMKMKKEDLIDMHKAVCVKHKKTDRHLELMDAINNVHDILDKDLKHPLKFIDVLRDDDDPRAILANLKQTVGQISLLLEIQTIKELAHPKNRAIVDGMYPTGSMVSIRPCGDEYEDKTYIGFLIGEVALGSSITITDGMIQLNHSRHNPAIFVPELGKIIYGIESWWGVIKSEEDFKKITDDDIDNVWYVKAYREMLDKNKSEEEE